MKHAIAIVFAGLSMASALFAADAEIVEIRLGSDTTQALYAAKKKPVEFSKSKASKFRLQPGLADKSLTSFELVGAKNHYLRGRGFVLHLDENVTLSPLFNADTSFKVVRQDDGKVRLESSNYPNKFLALDPSGGVVLISNPKPEQSTFVLSKGTSPF